MGETVEIKKPNGVNHSVCVSRGRGHECRAAIGAFEFRAMRLLRLHREPAFQAIRPFAHPLPYRLHVLSGVRRIGMESLDEFDYIISIRHRFLLGL